MNNRPRVSPARHETQAESGQTVGHERRMRNYCRRRCARRLVTSPRTSWAVQSRTTNCACLVSVSAANSSPSITVHQYTDRYFPVYERHDTDSISTPVQCLKKRCILPPTADLSDTFSDISQDFSLGNHHPHNSYNSFNTIRAQNSCRL